MKKMLAILMFLHGATVNAFEYSSDHDDHRNYERERDEWIDSDSRQVPRLGYQQSYQQPPIQIYIAPNQNSDSRFDGHRRRSNRDQNREELYLRERRKELYWRERHELQQMQPYENQFYRDDTHW